MSTESNTQAIVPFNPVTNRAAILSKLGITDNGSLSLTKLVKAWLEGQGFKKAELRDETNRILRGGDVQGFIDAEIGAAARQGWDREIRYGKPSAADGKVRKIYITLSEPKAAKVKAMTRSQEDKLVELFGGKDSQLAKQALELLSKGNMRAKEVVRNVETEKVEDKQPAESAS